MLLIDWLEKQGYNMDVKRNWEKYTNLWESWYQGKVKDFHQYRIYNGTGKHINQRRLSMQMGKKACEDWADLLFNERVQVTVEDDKSNEQLQEVLTDNDFWVLINEAIELSGSTGTGAIITSVTNINYDKENEILDVTESEVKLEYTGIKHIYPLTWVGRRITECAFACDRTIQGKKYVILSMHIKGDDGNYKIKNHYFKDNDGALSEILDEAIQIDDSLREFDTQSDIPWFSIISPAGTNSIDQSLPWGMPFFSQAIDTMRALDTAFDALDNEIQLGRKRIFIRQELTDIDSTTGDIINVFDPNDIAYYVLPRGFDQKDLLQTEASELRVTALVEDIESNLTVFSNQCGFGQNHYQFQPPAQQTATGVVSQNSALFRRKKKHEIPLESALYDIIKSVSYAATHFGQYNINYEDIVVKFDDSIVEDENVKRQTALAEISSGVKAPYEYRMEFYTETEDKAKKMITEIEGNVEEPPPDNQTTQGEPPNSPPPRKVGEES